MCLLHCLIYIKWDVSVLSRLKGSSSKRTIFFADVCKIAKICCKSIKIWQTYCQNWKAHVFKIHQIQWTCFSKTFAAAKFCDIHWKVANCLNFSMVSLTKFKASPYYWWSQTQVGCFSTSVIVYYYIYLIILCILCLSVCMLCLFCLPICIIIWAWTIMAWFLAERCYATFGYCHSMSSVCLSSSSLLSFVSSNTLEINICHLIFWCEC